MLGSGYVLQSPTFEYDSNSTQIAVASRFGAVFGGNLEYLGVKEFKQASEDLVAQQKALTAAVRGGLERAILHLASKTNVNSFNVSEESALRLRGLSDSFKGVLIWAANTAVREAGKAYFFSKLKEKNYSFKWTETMSPDGTVTTNITATPSETKPDKDASSSEQLQASGVPSAVVKDWKDAEDATLVLYPNSFKDGGITLAK